MQAYPQWVLDNNGKFFSSSLLHQNIHFFIIMQQNVLQKKAWGAITIERKTGKARAGAYFQWLPTVRRSVHNLHVLTGAHIMDWVIPTWPKGKALSYTSPGFPSTANSMPCQKTDKSTQTPPQTPDCRKPLETRPLSTNPILQPRPSKPNPQQCQVCLIYFRTEADKADPINNNWVGCAGGKCAGFMPHVLGFFLSQHISRK